MEDQLISHKTAVLAIKAGVEKDIWIEYDEIEGTTDGFESIQHQITQSLLQRWLREEYNIHIHITLNQFGYGFMYALMNCKEFTCIKNLVGGVNHKLSTYEEALEQALQEALKLIQL